MVKITIPTKRCNNNKNKIKNRVKCSVSNNFV